MVKTVLKKFIPKNTRRFMVARTLAQTLGLVKKIDGHPDTNYAHWIEFVEPLAWLEYRELPNQPLISIVVPAFNTPKKYLEPLVYSVMNQSYQKWELILVNASTNDASTQLINSMVQKDNRIRIVRAPSNKGISGNTNIGIKEAKGEYVAFCDHDDAIAPQALFEVVTRINDNKETDLIYSDEDKVSDDGFYRQDPHFKSDFSLSLLRELNYINHFSVIKKSTLNRLGGLRSKFDGAQDYDLLLRLVDDGGKVEHIPKVLYHWRIADNSTASDISSKSYVLEAGVSALTEHLQRRSVNGDVKALAGKPGFYRIRFSGHDTKVGCVINGNMGTAHVREVIKQISNEDIDYKIIIANTKLPNLDDRCMYTSLDWKHVVKDKFLQDRDVLIYMNMPIRAESGWLSEISNAVQAMPEVGALMPIILDGTRHIEDSGLLDIHGTYTPLFKGCPFATHQPIGDSDWVRDVAMFTGNVFAIKNDLAQLYVTGNSLLKIFESIVAEGKLLTVWSHVVVESMSTVNYMHKSNGGITSNMTVGNVHLKLPFNKQSLL